MSIIKDIENKFNKEVIQEIRRFEYLLKRKAVLINKKVFLIRCLNNNLVPKTLRPKLNGIESRNLNKILKNCGLIVVKDIINSNIKVNIAKIYKQIESQRQTLLSVIGIEFFNKTNEYIRSSVQRFDQKLRDSHQKKFINLKNEFNGNKTDKAFVVNISDKVLSEEQTRVLSLGPKYEKTPINIPMNDIITSVEMNIKSFTNEEKTEIREKVSEILNLNFKIKHNLNKNEIKAINELKNDKNIKILNSDKNSGTVVMNTSAYNTLVLQHLKTSIYNEIRTNVSYDKIQSELKKLIKRLINEQKLPLNIAMSLLVDAPILPRFYCMIKVHKTPIAIRPIISTVICCTYRFANFVKNLIKNLFELPANFIKNRSDFVGKVKDFRLEMNDRLISIDVTSLYTSIPLIELKSIIKELFKEIKVNDCQNPLVIRDLEMMFEVILNDNIFVFEDKCYKQTNGLFMGSRLSPILSNIYMDFFIRLVRSKAKTCPKLWLIYVDDSFIIWNQNFGEFSEFLNLINNLRPNNIKFTVEYENERKLPFLDLIVERNGNNLSFDLYQKPSNVKRYLNFNSNHHLRAKLAVIDSLILRCFLLSPEKCDLRLKEVIKDLLNNNYPKDLILKRIRTLNNKRLNVNENEKNKDFDHTVCIPFVPIISSKIGNVFKKFNTRVSFSRLKNDIYKDLYNHKSKVLNDWKSGVYRIDCKSCNKVYIGETKRYFKVRKKEHESAVLHKKVINNPIAEHCLKENHEIDWNSSKVIKQCDKEFIRKFNESIEIRRFDEQRLMNRNNGENIPYVWHKFLKKV